MKDEKAPFFETVDLAVEYWKLCTLAGVHSLFYPSRLYFNIVKILKEQQ